MDWHKYASTINTLVVTLAIVASGIWAIVEYRAEAVEQRKAQRFEAAMPFLQRQLDLCVEASDAAASLASATNAERIAVARDRFWQLYFGSLHIVEDFGEGSVENRMIGFGKALNQAPADNSELAAMNIDKRGLKSPALDIGKACRALIVKGWQEVVPQLRA